MALQYREDLITLMASEIDAEAAGGGPGSSLKRRYSNQHRRPDRVHENEEEKDRVMADLLSILQRIPIQIIGESLSPNPTLAPRSNTTRRAVARISR